jgi:hypothetical protein
MKFTGNVLKSVFVCLVSTASAGTVTQDSDSGPGSLRSILAAATDSETISFAPSLDGATIALTSGALTINGIRLTIDATALPSGITISGNDTSRILTIAGNSIVTLKGLHLRDGREITSHGGGIYAVDSQLNLEACTIRGCYTTYNGGGIYGHGLTGAINRCLIAGNQSMSFGGGIYLIDVDTFDVRSSQISGNKSPDGGGISGLGAHPSLSNCSIQGNSGGGIRNDFDSNPMLSNCIVWGNTVSGGTVASKQVRSSTNSHPNITFSLIEGASGAASFNDGALVVWGAGNLNGSLASSDPDFVAPVSPANAPNPNADLRVYNNSPVIDAGENSPASTALDLAGHSRIQGEIPDLGAYEGGYVSFAYLHPTLDPTGDNNGNGMSNAFEYALGVDPDAPWDPAALPFVSKDANRLLLTSTQRTNGIDITPLWLTSASLSPASWIPMIENVHFVRESNTTLAPGRDKVVFLLPEAETHRFYRQGFSVGD